MTPFIKGKIWFDFDIDIQAGFLITLYPPSGWNPDVYNLVIQFMCFNLYVYLRKGEI